jgi:hypothetical protein
MQKFTPTQIAFLYAFLFYITEDTRHGKEDLAKQRKPVEELLREQGLPDFESVTFDENGCPLNVPNGVILAWEREIKPYLGINFEKSRAGQIIEIFDYEALLQDKDKLEDWLRDLRNAYGWDNAWKKSGLKGMLEDIKQRVEDFQAEDESEAWEIVKGLKAIINDLETQFSPEPHPDEHHIKNLISALPIQLQVEFEEEELPEGTHLLFTDAENAETFCVPVHEITEIREIEKDEEPAMEIVGKQEGSDEFFSYIPMGSLWVITIK